MVLLDTNVLSEMMRPEPDTRFADWIVRQSSDDLFTAAMCQAEILAGLAVMPAGRRRAALEEAAHAMFADDFGGRILPFDADAAIVYAELFASRQKAGRPSGTIDLMLAAIARTQGAVVATRNIADFEGLGLDILDPWTSTP